MIHVELPTSDGVPEVVRGFATCLASVTEADIDHVPVPEADLAGAIGYWRSWLAGQGRGLVPIAKPSGFQWPGYWLAILDGNTAVLLFGSPSGVVLSPQRPELVGAPASELSIHAGYVVSSLDPALDRASTALPGLRGTVEAIALAESATAPMRSVQSARAVAGRGLEGDRYAAKAGTFTPANDLLKGYDLTLVANEVLEELELDPVVARRNLVTRGLDLNSLVGRRFRVGGVECLGQRLCEPCSHLEALTREGVLRSLIHRGGLRADVLAGGVIEIGSAIETID